MVSIPSSTLPTGFRGRSLLASPRKTQTSPPDGRNATSPLAKRTFGFSTPTLSSVNRDIIAGWTVTLLSNGRVLSREFTVKGARCLNKDNLAWPLPPTEAMHSTLDTEPAEGTACDIGPASDTRLNLFSATFGQTLIRPHRRADTSPRFFDVPSKSCKKGEAPLPG
jgi:hypothetical protein